MAYLYIPDNQMNGWSAGQAMPDRLTQLRQGQYQQQMTQPAQQNSGGILWVQGEEGAKGYLVAAGNSVMLMDSENSTFYIKSTDASGMPLPLRIFDYTERTMAPKRTLRLRKPLGWNMSPGRNSTPWRPVWRRWRQKRRPSRKKP